MSRIPYHLWPETWKANARAGKRAYNQRPAVKKRRKSQYRPYYHLLSPAQKAAKLKSDSNSRRRRWAAASPSELARLKTVVAAHARKHRKLHPYHLLSNGRKANKVRINALSLRRELPSVRARRRASQLLYSQRPEVRARRAIYRQRPAVRAREVIRRRRPAMRAREVIRRRRQYQQHRRNLLELGLYALARLSFSAASQTQRNATTTETKTVCPS